MDPLPYVPFLEFLGRGYDVKNGKYADSGSMLPNQTINWKKWLESGSQTVIIPPVEGKEYIYPKSVDYDRDDRTLYTLASGESMSEYQTSLQANAKIEGSFKIFSGSASTDFSKSTRENIANTFTRISGSVSLYLLSLPTANNYETLRTHLDKSFATALDNGDPNDLFKDYGTHIVGSLRVGGKVTLLYDTDTRETSSTMDIKATAEMGAKFVMKLEVSTEYKEAYDTMKKTSHLSVDTVGGKAEYGVDKILTSWSDWAKSVDESHPAFCGFGNTPFIPLWELASTKERRETLRTAMEIYLTGEPDPVEGPYLTGVYSMSRTVRGSWFGFSAVFFFYVPEQLGSDWYYVGSTPATPFFGGHTLAVKELVKGTLAPALGWNLVSTQITTGNDASHWTVSRIWEPIAPKNYFGLCHVAYSFQHFIGQELPDGSEPPADITSKYRTVHKYATNQGKWENKMTGSDFNGLALYERKTEIIKPVWKVSSSAVWPIEASSGLKIETTKIIEGNPAENQESEEITAEAKLKLSKLQDLVRQFRANNPVVG